MDVIWVRSGTPGDAVALWERAPEHPDGEVFVVGPARVRVAVTPAVVARLRDGRLLLDTSRTPAPDALHEPAAGADSAAARGDHPDTVAAKPAAPLRRDRRR